MPFLYPTSHNPLNKSDKEQCDRIVITNDLLIQLLVLDLTKYVVLSAGQTESEYVGALIRHSNYGSTI